ncbi:MAG: d(CMP) kinase [Paracoccaceae bacterium]|mgnify:FL=1|nr:d(CMP) kinase [Paracoccaceae bacterium]
MSFTIAIDGPAAAGKGTISKAVAAEFGFAHLDTGLLYRAVGAKVLAGTEAVQAAQNLQSEDFGNADLRTTKVAEAASKVAAIPAVRSALLDFQIEFAARDGGAVLDGRDIGTVICPNADVKLFVTASAEVRADRRFKELSAKGDQTDFQKVLAAVIARDERDAARDVAPMVAAADAITLDTSDMSIENAVAQAISAIRKKYIPS